MSLSTIRAYKIPVTGWKNTIQIATVVREPGQRFYSFRAGFRESIKLYKTVVERNESAARRRLKNGLTVGTHAPFGDDCLLGARVGANYYARFPKKALSEINDFEAIDKTYRQALSSVEKFRTANLDYFTDRDRSPLGTVLRTPLYLEQLDFRVEVLDADKSLARFNDNLADFTRRHPQR